MRCLFRYTGSGGRNGSRWRHGIRCLGRGLATNVSSSTTRARPRSCPSLDPPLLKPPSLRPGRVKAPACAHRSKIGSRTAIAVDGQALCRHRFVCVVRESGRHGRKDRPAMRNRTFGLGWGRTYQEREEIAKGRMSSPRSDRFVRPLDPPVGRGRRVIKHCSLDSVHGPGLLVPVSLPDPPPMTGPLLHVHLGLWSSPDAYISPSPLCTLAGTSRQAKPEAANGAPSGPLRGTGRPRTPPVFRTAGERVIP